MAPKGTKRGRPAAASSVLEVPRKKRGVASPSPEEQQLAERCSAVEEALRRTEQVPQEVRNMLTSAVRSTLAVPKADRHPFQEKIVGFIGEVLAGLEKSLEEAVAAVQAKVDGADAEKASRTEKQAQAEAFLAERKAATAEKQAAFDSTTGAFQEAATAVKAAEAAQKSGNQHLDQAAGKKQTLEKIHRELYVPLKDGTSSVAESKKQVNSLIAQGKKLGFEQSLLAALPGVLMKAPAARGEFELMAMKQLEEELASRVVQLEATMREGEAGRAERAEQVQSAKAVWEGAKAAQEDSAAALEAAKAAQHEAEQAVKTAQESVEGFLPEMERNCSELEEAKASLASFREGALAAFTALRDPPQAAAPAEEPPADAEPVAAPVEATNEVATESLAA